MWGRFHHLPILLESLLSLNSNSWIAESNLRNPTLLLLYAVIEILSVTNKKLKAYLVTFSGEESGSPLQYSCLENPVDAGAWWAAAHRVARCQTWLRWLSMHSCIGDRNGNLLQYSCLENPRDGGVWWVAVYGVARSQTRLKQLSRSSSSLLLLTF